MHLIQSARGLASHLVPLQALTEFVIRGVTAGR